MTETGDNDLEVSLWYDANVHLDPINSCSESIKDMLDLICKKNSVVHGNIRYEILKPGDDRVPSVPRWLENTNGVIPRLLIATTKVTRDTHQEPMGISGDLGKKDLARLRLIVQKEYRMTHPNTTPLVYHECDKIIDKLGLEVVMDQLRSNTVH
jgi:hypothetical protein